MESLAWQRRLHNWNSDKQPTSNQNSSTLSKHTLRGWSIHGERLGERLAIRVPRTYNCVVPLAVRKTLRTALDACLQLPENPDLPRWFQAKMTFQVNLSDTKRAQTFNIDRSLLHRFKLKSFCKGQHCITRIIQQFQGPTGGIFEQNLHVISADLAPRRARTCRWCPPVYWGPQCGSTPWYFFPQLWASDFHGWHMNGIWMLYEWYIFRISRNIFLKSHWYITNKWDYINGIKKLLQLGYNCQ